LIGKVSNGSPVAPDPCAAGVIDCLERTRASWDTPAAAHRPPDLARGQLAAIFGHELRSHIAPIKNAAELLRCAALDREMTLNVAALINRQVDGMTRLIDELLASTRSETLLPTLRRGDITVEDVVKLSVELVAPLASARRQTLLISMPAAPVRVAADEMWLAQALQNVLGNAVKYTDAGGQIEVEAKRDLADVVISVRDTGVGLTPTQLETVFDLYAQVAQPATRPPAGGLGVGLHVAKWVIEAHGGSIQASSKGLGRGTTFVIRLPCCLGGVPSR
jgi:signal transduction histidine kinase